MTDMVERVAKAIDDTMIQHGYYDTKGLARAAIAAMREPSEKMIDVGFKEQQTILSKPIEGIWTAMIDAALDETKSTAKGE